MVTARGSCDARALSQPAEAVARVAPARTLLGNINSHLICVLCRGYYIDATTIVECLHTFCRSCIVKHLRVKSYCPVCEMMINSARPNIKLDKALQDIVYKLVPGLFQREMARRRAFYAARPHLAADVTPEQRGEDTERVVFSPEDVISFSLEYSDNIDEAGSSGSSESGNEGPSPETLSSGGPSRRYLRCPAVVNISHLKKFLSLKFDIDVAHFFVNILYKRVPLPDYYTLMDIAYIYNWKRIEPMRFFYQISDFSAIRDRFGFLELENSGGGRGTAPSAEPPQSDASSGSSSPPPDDPNSKSRDGFCDADDKDKPRDGDAADVANSNVQLKTRSKSPATDVEKSQFLNSFELTAKCSSANETTNSPIKEEPKIPVVKETKHTVFEETKTKTFNVAGESGSVKRKSNVNNTFAVPKRIKTETFVSPKPKNDSKSEASGPSVLESLLTHFSSSQSSNTAKVEQKPVPNSIPVSKSTNTLSTNTQESKRETETPKPKKVLSSPSNSVQNKPDINAVAKKCKNSILKSMSLKRKLGSIEGIAARVQAEKSQMSTKLNLDPAKDRQSVSVKVEQNAEKNVSPMAGNSLAVKPNTPNVNVKIESNPKQSESNKESQKVLGAKPRKEGDPLRSLFNSCNINIPSSLSITLTDLKMEQKQIETPVEKPEIKKPVQAMSNLVSTNPSMQISSQPITTPPDKNCLEIIKLPDEEGSSPPDNPPTTKSSTSTSKPLEPIVTAKGPIPNLKPISEAKIVPFSKPQTFQQTFLQSLQQQKEKPKFNKARLVLPKIASGNSSNGKSEETSDTIPSPKPGTSLLKPQSSSSVPSVQKFNFPKSVKSDSALDLSTPHTIQSQLGPQHAKALETMQSIAILAKKQCFNQRLASATFSQDAFKTNPSTSLRVPVPISNNSHLKLNISQSKTNSPKHFPEYFQPIKQSNVRSPNDNSLGQSSKSSSQPSPISHPNITERSQTRSPSSSPKLVIACPSPKSQSPEQKQFVSPRINESNSQSNLISSSNVSSTNVSSNEPSGSKDLLKLVRNTKPQPINKLSSIRGPTAISNNIKTSSPSSNSPSGDILRTPQMIAQQAYIRQQLELQTTFGLLPPGAANQWLNNPVARAHFENIMKNMTKNNQMPFGNNNQNSKDK